MEETPSTLLFGITFITFILFVYRFKVIIKLGVCLFIFISWFLFNLLNYLLY